MSGTEIPVAHSMVRRRIAMRNPFTEGHETHVWNVDFEAARRRMPDAGGLGRLRQSRGSTVALDAVGSSPD